MEDSLKRYYIVERVENENLTPITWGEITQSDGSINIDTSGFEQGTYVVRFLEGDASEAITITV